AKRTRGPACEFNHGRQAAAAAGSRDDDPTSTSTGTGGFGAYALSGESVVVVVGNYEFAAGLTRKAAPSACARRFRDPRRSQCTPGSVDHADGGSIWAPGAGARAAPGRRSGAAGAAGTVCCGDVAPSARGEHVRARPPVAAARVRAGGGDPDRVAGDGVAVRACGGRARAECAPGRVRGPEQRDRGAAAAAAAALRAGPARWRVAVLVGGAADAPAVARLRRRPGHRPA